MTVAKLKTLNAQALRECITRELDGDYVALEQACDLATVLHANQIRKDPVQGRVETPYVEHCLRNVLRLIRFGVTDEDVLIATVLHDAVEDCSLEWAKASGSPELDLVEAHKLLTDRILLQFGERATFLVQSVTNPPETKTWKARTDEEKFAEYQPRVEEKVTSDSGTCLVKLTDYIDNAGSLHWTPVHSAPRAVRLSCKYLPLVPVFRRALREHDLSVHGVGADDIERMDASLVALGERLERLHP